MEDFISFVIWLGIIAIVVGKYKNKIFGNTAKPGTQQNVKGAAPQKSYGNNSRAYGSSGQQKSVPAMRRQSSVMESSRRESSAMPHKHRESGVYDTANRKSWLNDSGAMPHKHESDHYTAMMDVSKLPPGYILLNGEPVRVADLEGK